MLVALFHMISHAVSVWPCSPLHRKCPKNYATILQIYRAHATLACLLYLHSGFSDIDIDIDFAAPSLKRLDR